MSLHAALDRVKVLEADLAEARRELEESRRIWHDKKAELEKFADQVVASLKAFEALEKEWWIEAWDEEASVWEFHSLVRDALQGQRAAERYAQQWGRPYRCVELLRRVLS